MENKKTLYIMCGVAGSGKTTWVREHAKPGVSAHISRDRIRFRLLKDGENYFAHENEVRNQYFKEVQDALLAPWVEEVYADATHLTEKSRMELVKKIEHLRGLVDIVPVTLQPTLKQILKQNDQREGRERVPQTVICNMYDSFEDPWDDNIEYKELRYE